MQKVFNLLGALGFVMSGTMAVMGVVALHPHSVNGQKLTPAI